MPPQLREQSDEGAARGRRRGLGAVAPLVLFPAAAGAFFVAAYLPPGLPGDGFPLSAFLAGAGQGVLTVPIGSNHPAAPESGAPE